MIAASLWAVIGSATGFGINGHIPGNRAADRIEEAGIEWVRIDFLWSFVETERDRYDWSIYDALVDRLEARGLKIFAGLGATPAWATSGPEFNGIPDDPEQWQEFCYLAARRYAGRIEAWGLWNEPNLDRFWLGTRNQYIDEILIPGARSIRLADPSALIAAPDLAHIGSANWDDWLFDVITAARSEIDVVTHHVYPSYGWADTVTEDLQYGGPFPFSPPGVRDILQDAGWWQRPFWLTETGVESADYGQGTQADFVSDLLDQWFGNDRRSRNWVDRIFFYELNDGPSPPQYTWGIVNGPPDFEPKSAYWAYGAFINNALIVDAELVGSDLPTFFAPGATVESSISFRNTGTLEWSIENEVILSVESVSAGWTIEVGQLEDGEQILPGQTRSFPVLLTPPSDDDLPPVVRGEILARMHLGDEDLFGDLLRKPVSITRVEPPAIVSQPDSAWVAPRQRTVLRIAADGAEQLSFRWFRNGVELEDNELYSGTGTAELTVTADSVEVEAGYLCEVSNQAGAVVSEPIDLVIGTAPPRRTDGRAVPDPGKPLSRGEARTPNRVKIR
jgi:hypothetical protein